MMPPDPVELHCQRKSTLNRRTNFALTTILPLILAIALFADHAIAQQKILKEHLVGKWALVSADCVRSDGSRAEAFGPNPIGTLI